MGNYNNHISVFKNEVLELMQIKPDGTYVDCTFGRGGHSKEILKKLSPKGKIIAIDCDLEAINYFNKYFKDDKRIKIFHNNFSNVDDILNSLNISQVDGFLYDFGVSSPQFDDPSRGFSYHGDAIIDMRMDQTKGLSANDVLMNFSSDKLTKIFIENGEIYDCKKVVNAIINKRNNISFFTTQTFVELIKENIPKKLLYLDKHPARKYFQALRIFVNNELESIKISLAKAVNFLNKNGRIITITFHSLEDKIVKDFFKEITRSLVPKEILINEKKEYEIIKTSYKPSDNEILTNNRSRSARIRCLEKIQ